MGSLLALFFCGAPLQHDRREGGGSFLRKGTCLIDTSSIRRSWRTVITVMERTLMMSDIRGLGGRGPKKMTPKIGH